MPGRAIGSCWGTPASGRLALMPGRAIGCCWGTPASGVLVVRAFPITLPNGSGISSDDAADNTVCPVFDGTLPLPAPLLGPTPAEGLLGGRCGSGGAAEVAAAMASSRATMFVNAGRWSGTGAQHSRMSRAWAGSVPGGMAGRIPSVATFIAAARAGMSSNGILRERHSHMTCAHQGRCSLWHTSWNVR